MSVHINQNEPPRDGCVFIVTEDAQLHEVRFCDQTKLYTGEEVWARTDGESGSWEASEIVGWSRDYESASAFLGAVALDLELKARGR
jgi:hypothetical protein